MRTWKSLILPMAALLTAAGFLVGQDQGPSRDPNATVARPRKKDAPPPGAEAEQPKIPSRMSKKDHPETEGLATFSSNVDMVSVDVAVIDNKGHFIPNIPRGNFRILEDNVPQQIKSFNMGEAPMTVAMVMEFSNRFQQYWGETWYQTLTAAYGFLETLKKDDYVAIVAYDMRSEILSRLLHRPHEGERSHAAVAHRRVFRSQPVRRHHRYRRPHEGN